MKTMKKVVAIFMAVAMTLAMSISAFADEPTTGTITVDNATIGQTYTAYKVFDLTYDSADHSKVSYTYTKQGTTDAFLNALLDTASSPFTLVKNGSTDTYTVSLATGKTNKDAIDFLKNHANLIKIEANKKKEVNAAAETINIDGLPFGYYFITSTLNNGTVATIDSTNPTATVHDKNQIPTWDNNPGDPGADPDDPKDPTDRDPGNGKVILVDGKQVTTNEAKFGDKVQFSVAVNATEYAPNNGGEIAKVKEYIFADALSDGFKAPTDIKVFVKTGASTDATPLGTDDYRIAKSGNVLNVIVPYKDAWGANCIIDVQYKAEVDTDAVIAGSGNLNTANFTYNTTNTPYTPGDNNPYDPTKPPYDPDEPNNPNNNPPGTNPPDKPFDPDNKKTTTTYVYALGIEKVDGTTKAALKGAEFTINVPVKATGTTGVYEYNPTGTAGNVTLTTTDAGLLVIKGLTTGEYELTETKAPAGYNLLPTAQKVKVEATGQTNVLNISATKVQIDNNSGAELPETGGMGTTLFYILGGLLVVAAGFTFVVRRKMNKEL